MKPAYNFYPTFLFSGEMLFCNTDVSNDLIDLLNNAFDVMLYHIPRVAIQLEYGVAVPSFCLFRSF